MNVEQVPRAARPGPFSWGVLAGLLILPTLDVGNQAALRLMGLRDTARTFDVQVLSAGADVSQAGGARLLVRSEGRSLTQVCNGPCDDLTFEARVRREDVYRVDVLDGEGRCVACDDQGQYVDGGYGSLTTQWRIGGSRPLRVNRRTVEPRD